ncbi:MAG: DUF503 domain-containing protein [Proteobacteria bacterium]|nr:DUF503 domain-containing protein [Pseudomonadota bacterium]
MLVGALLVEIRVHGSQSLKAKRGVVQSIKQRVRNRFNLAVAEVGGQETWQRALLGISGVSSDARSLRRTLERAVEFIEDLHLAEVTGSEVELVELPHRDVAPEDEELFDPVSDEE